MVVKTRKFVFCFICLIVLSAYSSIAYAADEKKDEGGWFFGKKKKEETKQAESKKKEEAAKVPANVSASLPTVPAKPIEDVTKIQGDLTQIIERTEQLQRQVRDDRSEIQQILERAQIHQRILKSITIPQPIQSRNQIDQNEIIAREKMRLIAQQAHDTQEHLRAIQNSRLINSVPSSVPSSVPKAESSKAS